jgi:serine/threonine protein kinase
MGGRARYAHRMERRGPDPRIGSLVEQWRIVERLAEGAEWSVYRAKRFGEECVMRILDPEAATLQRIAHFHAVGNHGSALAHPDVVDFSECGQSRSGEWFLRCPYVPDPSFARHASEANDLLVGSLSPGRPTMKIAPALAATAKVLDCLSAAHDAGVLHGDVRPEGLFLGPEGRVRVASFRLGPRVHTFSLGDASFTSPEQAMGLDDHLDARADLFSVGAVLRCMLTGLRLHEGKTFEQAWVAAATIPVKPLAELGSALPEKVVRLIDTAMQWDRRNRYADARAMRNAVLEAAER